MSKRYKDIIGDGGSNIVAQVSEQTARLRQRMEQVRHTIAILSGKGGVGKSVITANLACLLADRGYRVGALDADFGGPSLAKMLCGSGREVQQQEIQFPPICIGEKLPEDGSLHSALPYRSVLNRPIPCYRAFLSRQEKV